MDENYETYVTATNDGEVLAVVRMTDDEYQKYVDGQWVEPSADDRTVYDQSLWQIDPSKVSTAAQLAGNMGNLSEAKDILLDS